MPQAEIPAVEPGAGGEGLEQVDALANELDLLRVVELEPEGPGRDRGGQRRQRRPALEHDHVETRPGCEEGGRAADHPATDHHDVGRGRRRIGETDGRLGAHGLSLGR